MRSGLRPSRSVQGQHRRCTVGLCRDQGARKGAAIYIDSRAALTYALSIRDGAQVGAIDEPLTDKGAGIATPATLKAVGMAIGG